MDRKCPYCQVNYPLITYKDTQENILHQVCDLCGYTIGGTGKTVKNICLKQTIQLALKESKLIKYYHNIESKWITLTPLDLLKQFNHKHFRGFEAHEWKTCSIDKAQLIPSNKITDLQNQLDHITNYVNINNKRNTGDFTKELENIISNDIKNIAIELKTSIVNITGDFIIKWRLPTLENHKLHWDTLFKGGSFSINTEYIKTIPITDIEKDYLFLIAEIENLKRYNN